MKPWGPLALALALSACSARSPSAIDAPTLGQAPSAGTSTGHVVALPTSPPHASASSCADLADAQRDSTEALGDASTPQPKVAVDAALMDAVRRLMVKAVARPSGDRNFDSSADAARTVSTKVSIALAAPHASVAQLLGQLKVVDADLSDADGECPD